jgi:hypothetical protein
LLSKLTAVTANLKADLTKFDCTFKPKELNASNTYTPGENGLLGSLWKCSYANAVLLSATKHNDYMTQQIVKDPHARCNGAVG